MDVLPKQWHHAARTARIAYQHIGLKYLFDSSFSVRIDLALFILKTLNMRLLSLDIFSIVCYSNKYIHSLHWSDDIMT
jgi:hypothetical protein